MYNADDQVVQRRVDDGTTSQTEFYVHNGNGRVLALDSNEELLHRTLWGAGVDQLLVDEAFDANGQVLDTFWAATDHLGSVGQLLDDHADVVEHREYDSFGAIDAVYDEMGSTKDSSQLLSDVAHAGSLWDNDAGLYQKGQRFYDPDTGRFLSEDPIGFGDGPNQYRYAGNDPVNFRDPTGLSQAGNPLNNLFGTSGGFSGGVVAPAPESTNLSLEQIYGTSPFSSFNTVVSSPGIFGANGSIFNGPISTRSVSPAVHTSILNAPTISASDLQRARLDFNQASAVSPAGPTEYFTNYANDVIFSDRLDHEDAFRRAQSDVDTGTPFQAFNAQLAMSLSDASEGFYPGVGEFRDAEILFGSNSGIGERALALASLGLSVATLGESPNIGPALRTTRISTHTVDDLVDLQLHTHRFDTFTNPRTFTQIDTLTAPSNFSVGGPYSYLVDPPKIGPSSPFTAVQRKKLLDENRLINQGVLRSDKSGIELVTPQRPQKGVPIPPNEANVDHIQPLSRRGTNSFSNAQVLSRQENSRKGGR